ncbi:MAG: hypothetical protein ACRDQ4_02925 [Pseudonocardiaceae bacterium]
MLAVSEFAATDLAAAYRISRPVVVANGIACDRFHPGPVVLPVSGEKITLVRDVTVVASTSVVIVPRCLVSSLRRMAIDARLGLPCPGRS